MRAAPSTVRAVKVAMCGDDCGAWQARLCLQGVDVLSVTSEKEAFVVQQAHEVVGWGGVVVAGPQLLVCGEE